MMSQEPFSFPPNTNNIIVANLVHVQVQDQTSSNPNHPNPNSNPPKRKRSLPGTPDPDAEVIALSPKSLTATNRFVCEICKKGFQRDQNLQLHRRGHNLPWKLKQRSKVEEVRKKVYICPEKSCVHHDPVRALGDLTGIKKHFFRKHGEKKWKCEKCSKKYAVHSDWKAHSKVCGTREYKCDCGTVFSRKDSFVTHRAFCESLAEQNARTMMSTSTSTLPATSLLSNLRRNIPHINNLPPLSSGFLNSDQLIGGGGVGNSHGNNNYPLNIGNFTSKLPSGTDLVQAAMNMFNNVSPPQPPPPPPQWLSYNNNMAMLPQEGVTMKQELQEENYKGDSSYFGPNHHRILSSSRINHTNNNNHQLLWTSDDQLVINLEANNNNYSKNKELGLTRDFLGVGEDHQPMMMSGREQFLQQQDQEELADDQFGAMGSAMDLHSQYWT